MARPALGWSQALWPEPTAPNPEPLAQEQAASVLESTWRHRDSARWRVCSLLGCDVSRAPSVPLSLPCRCRVEGVAERSAVRLVPSELREVGLAPLRDGAVGEVGIRPPGSWAAVRVVGPEWAASLPCMQSRAAPGPPPAGLPCHTTCLGPVLSH